MIYVVIALVVVIFILYRHLRKHSKALKDIKEVSSSEILELQRRINVYDSDLCQTKQELGRLELFVEAQDCFIADLKAAYETQTGTLVELKTQAALSAENRLRLEQCVQDYEYKLKCATEANAKVVSERKSSEVRTGQIAEAMAPFLDCFKYNPKVCKFIGSPIDYVVFDTDNERIVFLEIKSGESKLSPKQNKIKRLIGEGKVEWDEFRIA